MTNTCDLCGKTFEEPDGWFSMYCRECEDWLDWLDEQAAPISDALEKPE